MFQNLIKKSVVTISLILPGYLYFPYLFPWHIKAFTAKFNVEVVLSYDFLLLGNAALEQKNDMRQAA